MKTPDIQKITQISFIRHGDVHNPGEIFYGRLPGFHLSSKGHADAVRAGNVLKKHKIKAVFSSPLLRTRQTADAILTHHPKLGLTISKDLIEVKSYFEGRHQSALQHAGSDVYHFKDPEWEQPSAVLTRTQTFIRSVRKAYHDGHVAAVTHGDVVLFAMFWALGIEASPENKLKLHMIDEIQEYPATGSITTFSFSGENADEIPYFNYVIPENKR